MSWFVSIIILVSSASYADSAAAVPEIVHHRGDDIQVFSAKLGNTLGHNLTPTLQGTYTLNYDKCKVVRTAAHKTRSQIVRLDCSAQTEFVVEQKGKQAATLIAPVLIDALRGQDGRWLPRSGLCELIEIWAFVKESEFRNFGFMGIGFYYSHANVPLMKKERLKPTWRKQLKDGTPVVVMKFIAPGVCFGTGGNSSALLRRSYEFKPYALRYTQTQYGSDYLLFNWDAVGTNYLLGRTHDGHGFVKHFDRSHELIQWR